MRTIPSLRYVRSVARRTPPDAFSMLLEVTRPMSSCKASDERPLNSTTRREGSPTRLPSTMASCSLKTTSPCPFMTSIPLSSPNAPFTTKYPSVRRSGGRLSPSVAARVSTLAMGGRENRMS
eukprot:140236-Prorocentrum_minimum.AAC.1